MSDQDKVLHLGGSIEEALKGQVKLQLGQVFKEAAENGLKPDRSLLAPVLMLTGVTLMLVVVLAELLALGGWSMATAQGQSLAYLLATAALAPAVTAIKLMGVHQVVGLKPPTQLLWHWYRHGPLLSLTALICLGLVNLGSAFYLVPGIFLQIALAPALMLVADKGLSPLNAIKTSVLVCLRYFPAFLISQLLLLLMVVLVAFSFGLALVWLGPLYLRFTGVLYRELFGVKLRMTFNQPQTLFNA
ncbi:hypothetical protein [Gallaecimonas xiamenensis]|uniref:Integral membrane protein n=1 Tax=Gallaecimonas xiamenensis 3-C-1 TaxID=745411 RepID=K2J1G2_9GAMM|nr:hypothetical protein [Gallaecimonas xiamenensis]EKE76791.1 hypothetical protein B3C1_04320 [Gallaecimonas xiamenensis 3-C-1]